MAPHLEQYSFYTGCFFTDPAKKMIKCQLHKEISELSWLVIFWGGTVKRHPVQRTIMTKMTKWRGSLGGRVHCVSKGCQPSYNRL